MFTTSSISIVNVNDGQNGAKGDRGISITKTREQWFLSTSNSSLSGNAGTVVVDGESIPVGTWTYTEPSVIPDNYYLWGRLETTMSDTSVQYSDAVYRSTIAGLKSEVDKANLAIEQEVWQDDISTAISNYDGSTTTTMYSRWSSLNQNLSGITTRVGNVETTISDLGTRMTTAESSITQNADKINLMVSVDDTTSALTLTNNMLSAITDQFIIKDPNGTATVISGGRIQNESITTNMLATDAIKSTNYVASSNTNSPFTSTGSFFDLSNGNIYTPNFGIINTSWQDGPAIGAYFNGRVEADSGKFGNSSSYWNIETVYDYYSQPHAALVGTGSPYLQTGNWQVSDDAVSTRKYTSSSASTGNVGYYSNGGYYYDFGMKVITPDGDSDSVDYKKSLFYFRKADTQHGVPSLDSGWTYPFRVDSDGHLYCTDLTIIGGGTPTTFLPIGGGTITGDLTVEGTLTATASKASELATTHTIITDLASTNGAAYTGKSNITPGVTGTLGVGHGGTGKYSWTQWGIVYASATNTLAQIGAGTSGQVLRSNGSAAPSWTNQSALSVGSATKATQDADGNVISSTYRKLDNGVFDTIQVTDLTAGDLMVTGVGRFTNGLYGDLTGNADTATTWKTARTLTVGNTGKSVNGSANVSWSKSEISGLAVAASADTTLTSNAGWLSGADKYKLDNIQAGAQVNTVTGVKGNSESNYRTGNINITATNIGLGNLTNNKQVKGLASGTTSGHFVSWGSDGYTVADSGYTASQVVKSLASNNDGKIVLTYLDGTTSDPIEVKIIGSSGSSVSYADALNVNGTAVGSSTQPVYIDNQGKPALANKIPKLNGSSSDSAFYAPTAVGTSGQVLKSNGSGAPSWVDQSSLSVGSASSATTATKFSSARTIALTGDVTGSVSSDGTSGWSITTSGNAMTPIQLSGTNKSLNDCHDTLKTKFYYGAGDNGVTENPVGNAQFGMFTYASATGYVTQELSSFVSATNKGKWIRFYNASTWSDWEKFLTSANYTDYTVTKTGTGASGTWGISISGNAATATSATSSASATNATNDSDGNPINSTYLKLSGGTMTGDILFKNSGTTTRQIRGQVGGNDYWRIAGGATASNAGWMEIATADDGNEPVYARQYTGAYTTIKRTMTLLDASGNTSIPGTFTINTGVTLEYDDSVQALNFNFN